MLQSPKFLQSSARCLLPPTPQPPPPILQVPGSSFPSIKQLCKLSRRELAIRSNSLLLLLLGSQSIEAFLPPKAEAEEDVVDTSRNEQEENSTATPTCGDKTPTKRAFLDISIDGEPVGRIVIGLQEDDAPVGAARFRNLVSGAAGVSEEWESVYEKCPGIKNKAGTVGIIVRDPSKPPPKIKLVARQGKLEIDQEEVGTAPNGTEFVISTKDSPELDASALVVGRVLEGMEVVERLGQVKTVQENTSSPYFRVAKLIGDKRAVVAERGFNRPYAKVVVTNCGLMQ